MVSGEDEAAIDKALALYTRAKSLQTLPAELRSSILSVAVKHGPKDAVDRLLKAYTKASADIQLDITSALASTKDPKVAKHIYGKALGPKGFVRSQDMMRWLVVFIRNPHIRKFVWQYIQDEWEWIEGVLKDSKSFDFLPIYCASAFNSAEWEKEFHNFFEPKRTEKLLERNIAVGYADIAARVAWRKREEKKLAAWLAKL
jgi:aminopeptidase N